MHRKVKDCTTAQVSRALHRSCTAAVSQILERKSRTMTVYKPASAQRSEKAQRWGRGQGTATHRCCRATPLWSARAPEPDKSARLSACPHGVQSAAPSQPWSAVQPRGSWRWPWQWLRGGATFGSNGSSPAAVPLVSNSVAARRMCSHRENHIHELHHQAAHLDQGSAGVRAVSGRSSAQREQYTAGAAARTSASHLKCLARRAPARCGAR